MSRVLITAYGPYDDWSENASWLTLQALTRDLPEQVDLTTRLLPVDFDEVRRRLQSELAGEPFDTILHLGQAPGSGCISLEAFALNIGRDRGCCSEDALPLVPEGPPAYRSGLPLEKWVKTLRTEGVPAQVSFHAGEYLCNAAMYYSHYFSQQSSADSSEQPPGITFVHLPLDPVQVAAKGKDLASLPVEISAHAIRQMLLSRVRQSVA